MSSSFPIATVVIPLYSHTIPEMKPHPHLFPGLERPDDSPLDGTTSRPVDQTSPAAQEPHEPSPVAPDASALSAITPSHIIKIEANLLRFPVFSLRTKGLKTLDGIECVGKRVEEGKEHRFALRVTRNTAHVYPGPLSRKAHFAILSIITESGIPFRNPITWTWRDLARRMGVSYAGQVTIDRLKRAICSTHGIVITTQYALKDGSSRVSLPKRERGYHLYADYTFVNDGLPDGEVADTNYLWLSDWYLANLNALYSAPLDYDLWRFLNDESPIASRMYEFLLFNFSAGIPVFRINYPTLAQFLPVRTERYLSKAKEQLSPVIELLRRQKLLTNCRWSTSKGRAIQLSIAAGPRLQPAAQRLAIKESGSQQLPDDFQVREVRNLNTPEWRLVNHFHILWTGHGNYRPTKKELAFAQELVAQHGVEESLQVVEHAIKLMKTSFPDAKTFGALRRYLPEAQRACGRSQQYVRQKDEEARRQQRDELKVRNRKQKLDASQAAWETLSATEREQIRSAVLEKQPAAIRNFPQILHNFCLDELAKRRRHGNNEASLTREPGRKSVGASKEASGSLERRSWEPERKKVGASKEEAVPAEPFSKPNSSNHASPQPI